MTAAQELPYGFSPHSSVAAEFDDVFDPIHFDEDEYALADEEYDEASQAPASVAGTDAAHGGAGVGPKKSKRGNFRKGPQNADKRATHNAVERQRRESLNDKFTELARVLPTTASLKRPSKAVVISKALDYVYDTVNRERALIQENNDLRVEVDQLRASLGMPRLPPPQPLPERRMATAPTLRKSKKATHGTQSVPPEGFPQTAPLPTPALSDAYNSAAKQEPASPSMPTASEPSPATAALPPPSPALFPALGSAAIAAHSSPSAASVSSASAGTPSLVFDPASIATSVSSVPFPGVYAASPDANSPGTVGSLDGHRDSLSSNLSQQPNFLMGSAPTSQAPFPAASLAGLPQHVQAQASQFMQAAAAGSNPSQAFNPAAAAAYINPAILFALQQQQQHQHQQAQMHASQQQQQLNVSEWLAGYNNAVAAQSGMFATSMPSPPNGSTVPAAPHAFEGLTF